MLTVQARLSTVDGKGVGRWRKYYEADDLRDARRAATSLIPKALVRVMDGKTVVVPSRRVEAFVREDVDAMRRRLSWITSQPYWLETHGEEADELASLIEGFRGGAVT